jgi:hypothetical protein
MKEDESPVLYNHAIIVSNLLMLAKHECLISAFLGKKKILHLILNFLRFRV